MVITSSLELQARGPDHFIDITGQVAGIIGQAGLRNGNVTLFVPGSTAGLTTIEYEEGVLTDMHELMERMVPSGTAYHHDAAWGDGNGFSHLRASLIGPSLTIPFSGGKMCLGTWQQVVFMDFDNRPRRRELVCQLIGE
ncbi:MAG: YjbQ family protein [Acidobacteria bacterium]|nr:YjbQ family protein [Acidobacteriota bacterium]